MINGKIYLKEKVDDKGGGEGGKNQKILDDVICERPLIYEGGIRAVGTRGYEFRRVSRLQFKHAWFLLRV